jgi:hypothetical protein
LPTSFNPNAELLFENVRHSEIAMQTRESLTPWIGMASVFQTECRKVSGFSHTTSIVSLITSSTTSGCRVI